EVGEDDGTKPPIAHDGGGVVGGKDLYLRHLGPSWGATEFADAVGTQQCPCWRCAHSDNDGGGELPYLAKHPLNLPCVFRPNIFAGDDSGKPRNALFLRPA